MKGFWSRGQIWNVPMRGGAVDSLSPTPYHLHPPPVRVPKPRSHAELTILPGGSDNGV